MEYVGIFNKGGIVLWSVNDTSKSHLSSVNELISDAILHDQSVTNLCLSKKFVLNYKIDNQYDLILVAIHENGFQINYVDQLLDYLRSEFKCFFKQILDNNQWNIKYDFLDTKKIDFTEIYHRLLNHCVISDREQKRVIAMRTYEQSKKSSKNNKMNIIKIQNNKKRYISDSRLLNYSNQDNCESGVIPKSTYAVNHNFLKQYKEDNKTTTFLNSSDEATSSVYDIFKSIKSRFLTKNSIQFALDKLKDHLISKNISFNVADKLCESVSKKLNGKAVNTFDNTYKIVKDAITDTITQILTPEKHVNVIGECLRAKMQNRPYKILLCGVNGVGKTTSIGKLSNWLIENKLTVLIAACDTFRAGAIEQLRIHAHHLNALHPKENNNGKIMAHIYDRGYGKDSTGIAMQAIYHAKANNIDVVLLDTAGRMQGNEPLMRALANMINTTEPDLVLFVGEALAGNTSTDQLYNFEKVLRDFSTSDNAHLIDGIILTKFDTVDDKIGAALSMTYCTRKPIVFVGTGQTYKDLKFLDVDYLVNVLFK